MPSTPPTRSKASTTTSEKVSHRVLKSEVNDAAAAEALAAIARQEDLNGRIRRNVMDTRRAVSFMMRARMLNADQHEEARQILRDIDSLDSHGLPLRQDQLPDGCHRRFHQHQPEQNHQDLLGGVGGLAAARLVASVYGMNLKFPEMKFLGAWSYPTPVALMIASALVPMWYFHRRGWLS